MNTNGNKEVFGRNLSLYIEKSGKTQKEICEDLGFSRSSFNEWAKGKIYPRIDKIEILADYFGILKSDLIEDKWRDSQEENIKEALFHARVLKDVELMNAIKVYYTLTEKQQQAIINTIYSYK